METILRGRIRNADTERGRGARTRMPKAGFPCLRVRDLLPFSRRQFDDVLSVVEEQLNRRSTSRQSISAKQRLAIYLSLVWSYHVLYKDVQCVVVSLANRVAPEATLAA
ncbi:hypothetical protein DPMN_074458 [Dreissena polymorpha]|uniref:Uncharacterized protein n=1 Tax=Dreissena polymorpha TaxID=45954 RepID=A0A9D3YF13_DREPO|nr:hypothetical protein DPMN_074458 [Dreissena polymorpha]